MNLTLVNLRIKMSAVVVIRDEGHFQTELVNAGPKLVVVDFTARSGVKGPPKRRVILIMNI